MLFTDITLAEYFTADHLSISDPATLLLIRLDAYLLWLIVAALLTVVRHRILRPLNFVRDYLFRLADQQRKKTATTMSAAVFVLLAVIAALALRLMRECVIIPGTPAAEGWVFCQSFFVYWLPLPATAVFEWFFQPNRTPRARRLFVTLFACAAGLSASYTVSFSVLTPPWCEYSFASMAIVHMLVLGLYMAYLQKRFPDARSTAAPWPRHTYYPGQHDQIISASVVPNTDGRP